MTMEWSEYVQAWSRPPVDDVGYLSSAEMLTWPDARLMEVLAAMHRVRYEGWRNQGGLWRRYLALDTGGRRVLDYGCGVGMEAAELAEAGNSVAIADISKDNLDLAERVINLRGFRPIWRTHLSEDWPFFNCRESIFDTVNCSGVLHHIRKARLTMERFWLVLKPNGTVRLTLYSDQGWRLATGTEPPLDHELEDHDQFGQFVQWMDGTGDYATWYDAAKLVRLFGDLFHVSEFAYLPPDGRFCAAVLIRRDQA